MVLKGGGQREVASKGMGCPYSGGGARERAAGGWVLAWCSLCTSCETSSWKAFNWSAVQFHLLVVAEREMRVSSGGPRLEGAPRDRPHGASRGVRSSQGCWGSWAASAALRGEQARALGRQGGRAGRWGCCGL